MGFACPTAVMKISNFLLASYNIHPLHLSVVFIGHIPCQLTSSFASKSYQYPPKSNPFTLKMEEALSSECLHLRGVVKEQDVIGANRHHNLETTSTVEIRPSVVCDVTFISGRYVPTFRNKMLPLSSVQV